MFKTESIILKIESIRDNQTRVVLLTREYGKVSCWYRKRQFLHDIGDMIFVVLERDNSTNTIKFTENMYSPRESHWNYSKIRVFLESLALMNTLIPEMAPYASLFHDYRGLLTHMQKSESLHEHHYLLFQFRILRTL
jgi:recombinational DNA repair protein (RecF pathway)